MIAPLRAFSAGAATVIASMIAVCSISIAAFHASTEVSSTPLALPMVPGL